MLVGVTSIHLMLCFVVFRAVRQNNKPFGGIQLILSGDFLQLPPVTKAGAKRVFAFQVRSFLSFHLVIQQHLTSLILILNLGLFENVVC